MRFLGVLCLTVVLLLGAGCRSRDMDEQVGHSPLSMGLVKKHIVEGHTSQAEVLQIFGSPNMVTRSSSGGEVWSYQRLSQQHNRSGSYGGLILFGGSKAVSNSGTQSFDLIINFDAQDIVSEYKVISAAY